MARILSPLQTLADCARMQSMWKENPSLRLADLDAGQYDNLVRQIKDLTQQISDSHSRMIDAKVRCKELLSQANEINTRLRSATRGYFGVNASQLKQTGVKLRSERKSPSRKTSTEFGTLANAQSA